MKLTQTYDVQLLKLTRGMSDNYVHRSLMQLRYTDGNITLSQFNKKPGKPQRQLNEEQEKCRSVLCGIQKYLQVYSDTDAFDTIFNQLWKLEPNLKSFNRQTLDESCRGKTTRLWRQEKFRTAVYRLALESNFSGKML